MPSDTSTYDRVYSESRSRCEWIQVKLNSRAWELTLHNRFPACFLTTPKEDLDPPSPSPTWSPLSSQRKRHPSLLLTRTPRSRSYLKPKLLPKPRSPMLSHTRYSSQLERVFFFHLLLSLPAIYSLFQGCFDYSRAAEFVVRLVSIC